MGNETMPKILPALGAVAIIAFSIGFNIVRYPIVWEMVGASAHLPQESAESAMASHSTKHTEPTAVLPTETTARIPFSDSNISEISGSRKCDAADPKPFTGSFATRNHEATLTGMIITEAQPLAAKNAESQVPAVSYAVQTYPSNSQPPGNNTYQPMSRLVPVPSNLFIGNGTQTVEPCVGVQRLPPINSGISIPAGRYASEYPQAPIPIYPSTGVK
jgi:hypothetical protein